jgi:creatinine amidohydrolase/Fe(II)-dependent formamide hydrolase-like protein
VRNLWARYRADRGHRDRLSLGKLACVVAVFLGLSLAAMSKQLTAPPTAVVTLEDLTWVEVRDLIRQGKTTVIVPTGGTEQNGPHLVLGKHNYIVKHTATRVAETLGNALVAPVIALTPEGSIEPPSGHMAYPGTISLPEPVFAQVLEATARSLKVGGFRTIVLLGDSGDSQKAQQEVADRLDREWAAGGVRVIQAGGYYAANGQVEALLAEGESRSGIGSHAGIRDTSELMAVAPHGVRPDMMKLEGFYRERSGVIGDPTRASPERGLHLLQLKVDAAVAEIRRALAIGGS